MSKYRVVIEFEADTDSDSVVAAAYLSSTPRKVKLERYVESLLPQMSEWEEVDCNRASNDS